MITFFFLYRLNKKREKVILLAVDTQTSSPLLFVHLYT